MEKGTCEHCGAKEVELVKASYVDESGVGSIYVCLECKLRHETYELCPVCLSVDFYILVGGEGGLIE